MNSKKIKRILAFILCTVLMLSQIVMALADDGEGADPNQSDITQEASITPEATPEVTPEATPEVIITPEATPEPTPEAIPKLTSEVIPEATPSTTPEPTPEVTPEITPETTPVDPSTVDVETAEDWESTIPALANVYAEDLVAVAKSQLGYTQSRVNVTTDDNGTVTGAYSRYGAWNATPYVQWDNLFIKFCLNYANIPAEKFPQADSADEWITILSDEDYDLYVPATVSAAEYKPCTGDLIFMDTDEVEGADKTGIISDVTESTYQVIQEKDGVVSEVEYEKTDAAIVGYGMMPINMADEGATYEEQSTDKSDEEVVATGITIDQGDSLVGYTGEQLQLTVTFEPEGAIAESVTWTSSNTRAATVTEDGLVSFLKSGTTTITVTTENGLKDSLALTVRIPCSHTSGCSFAESAMPEFHQSTVTSDGEAPSLVVNKTITGTEDPNEFELMLEAYVTGSNVTVPMDIVLVLDKSGSMIQSQYHLEVDNPVKGYTYFSHGYYDKKLPDGTANPDYNVGYGLSKTMSPINWCEDCQAWIKTVYNPYGWDILRYEVVDVENTKFYETNLQAAERSLREFVNAIIDHGNENGVNHRIAIVDYGGSSAGVYHTDSRLKLYASNTNGVLSDKTYYESAYISVSEGAVIEQFLDEYTSAYYNKGILGRNGNNTPTHLGMYMAEDLLKYKPSVEGETISRNDMVVLFADGAPGSGRSIYTSYQSNALSTADRIKNNNIPVYAVGFYDDASLDPLDRDVNEKTYKIGSGDSYYEKSNAYFYKMASEDAFIPAIGASALSDAFRKIADNFSKQTLEYDAATVMREEISQYFILDCECEEVHTCGITVKTAECVGKDDNGDYLFGTPTVLHDVTVATAKTTKSPSTDVVNVTGFSYMDNTVMEVTNSTSTTYEGKKLILTVPIETRAGFWGGNNIPTNDASTALYHPKADVTDYSPTEAGVLKLTEIMKFPMPEANVPMTIDVKTLDKTIYYGGAMTAKELFSGITAGYSEDADGNWITPTTLVTVNEDGTLSPAESWMNDYASIAWTSDSTTAETEVNNKECGAYPFKVTMTADASATTNTSGHPGVDEDGGAIAGDAAIVNATLSTTEEEGNVHILVPIVTFEDSVINFGFVPDHEYFETINRVTADDEVEWVELNGHTDYPAVDETTKPDLTYEYTPRTDNFIADTPVDVIVTSSNVDDESGDITDVTTFEWKNCEEHDYHDSNEDITTPHKGDVDSYEFWIHLDTPYELPSTGGSGIYWYMISGMVLMMGTSLVLYKKKCKEVLKRR